jgi:hypothetical protein
MSFPPGFVLLLILAGLATAASAQDAPADSLAATPAVQLDVMRLDVDSLAVTADSVRARFNLDASVGGLLTVRAGLVVEIDGAEVEAEGVEAAADLRVQLETVARVLLEALDVLRERPELVGGAGASSPPPD